MNPWSLQTAYLKHGFTICFLPFRLHKTATRTRNLERTDMIVDYQSEQFIIEMKIWHSNAYKERGEAQLWDYLDYYHLDKGYMLSYNFNKKKKVNRI